jgi:molecular chaperone DnaK
MAPVKQALADAGVDPSKIDEVVLVGGSTRMPKVQQMVRDFFKKEPHKGVNPDEVVAIGAAVQGGVLTGDVTDMLLLDVTPLSLGIETLGGVTTVLIPRNTTIPTRKSEIFSTASDNQTNVEVHVLQGERPLARDNRTLGRFQLVGLPPAPRGVPQIEVAFDIDANGIVNVTAKDMATGKEQKITISGSGGLSKDDVARMVTEAQSHASEDQGRRDVIDARNQADSLAYQVEKSVAENREKLPVGELSKIDAAIAEVRKATGSDDLAAIRKATEELQRLSHAMAEQLYKQPAAGQAPPQDATSNVKDAEVVDAEYAETK